MAKILVTGGAGFIGSHVCKYLAAHAYEVVVYDNLSTGHREMVRWGAFEHGDVRDDARLRSVLRKHKPDALIHFASSISVGESVQDPGAYYDNNVLGSLRIMQVLAQEGVRPLVASGSAAVYGLPESVPVAETARTAPINPYGRTKLVMEWMLEDFARAHGLPWMVLRYFNAAGADPEGETGESHDPETHLIPNVLKAVRFPKERQVALFGDDYPTADGTCIRDYIHVMDLASAHVLACEHLLQGKASQSVNLGTGHGFSVREIVDAAERVTGRKVPYVIKARRDGDPARLVADPSKARELLGWQTRYSDIETILRTAWAWEQKKVQ